MKKLLLTAVMILFSNQALAWVSKDFTPKNISLINVVMSDATSNKCWTNINQSLKYTEDQLELAGFKVSKDKMQGYINNKHFVLQITVSGSRYGDLCFGSIGTEIYKATRDNAMVVGNLMVGQEGKVFAGYEDANKVTIEAINTFLDQVRSPNWGLNIYK